LSDGKTRLSPVLDPGERSALTREMLERVVRAALGTVSRAEVVVISPDPDALAEVGRIDPSIRLLFQDPERPGLNPALEQAAAAVREAGVSTVLILPADLPLISSADIDNVLRRDAPVVIAPDRHGTGTNALMVRLDAFGESFVFQFGEGSYDKHHDESARLGVDAMTAMAPGTSFELDTPADLAELDAMRVTPGAGRTGIPMSDPTSDIIALPQLPEIRPGDDLVGAIGDAIDSSGLGLREDDILVVTQKVVSKAEGRLVDLRTIEPSAMARDWAEQWGKDPRQVEVVLRESKRIVRMDRGVLIAETRHGFVGANAGVDAPSGEAETVCLLPDDPDASAHAIRRGLGARFGVKPGVIVSDSFGRPWRVGIVNVAIGAAGLAPLADYRGQYDDAGYELHVSVIAVADGLACAAELVSNKLDKRPVPLIRGYRPPVSMPDGSGLDLVIDPARDMFR
jgi:coenzyme F420-0:L-glutamate ligase/coenzyme F420-1:gamma-L-glutamate ligase